MSNPKPPPRIFGAQAGHLAAQLLRSSLRHLQVPSLRCSAPDHHLAHLDTEYGRGDLGLLI